VFQTSAPLVLTLQQMEYGMILFFYKYYRLPQHTLPTTVGSCSTDVVTLLLDTSQQCYASVIGKPGDRLLNAIHAMQPRNPTEKHLPD